MWAKRDVCIGYTPPRKSDFAYGPNARERYHDRKMMLVQADRSADSSHRRHGDAGESPPRLLWPPRGLHADELHLSR